MKNSPAALLSFFALLLVAGCDSTGIPARIQEKSAVFNTLVPWQQRDIENGVINVGFSTDMVYMALGKPTKIVTSANGQDTVWTYHNYFPTNAQSRAQLSLNTAGRGGYSGAVESANSPRSNKSMADTGGKGSAQGSLDVPDLPSDTLLVTFREGQVFQSKLESEDK